MRRVMENQSLPTPSVRASSLINPPDDDDNCEFPSDSYIDLDFTPKNSDHGDNLNHHNGEDQEI